MHVEHFFDFQFLKLTRFWQADHEAELIGHTSRSVNSMRCLAMVIRPQRPYHKCWNSEHVSIIFGWFSIWFYLIFTESRQSFSKAFPSMVSINLCLYIWPSFEFSFLWWTAVTVTQRFYFLLTLFLLGEWWLLDGDVYWRPAGQLQCFGSFFLAILRVWTMNWPRILGWERLLGHLWF